MYLSLTDSCASYYFFVYVIQKTGPFLGKGWHRSAERSLQVDYSSPTVGRFGCSCWWKGV